MNVKKYMAMGLSLALATSMTACSDSDNDNDKNDKKSSSKNDTYEYQVTVTNITHNQPFSPLAVVLHDNSETLWALGEASTTSLEILAESGNAMPLLDDADLAGAYDTELGDGVVPPGEMVTLDIESDAYDEMSLSVVSMLVNTNDAFTGKQGIDVSALEIGDSLQMNLPVYDAGTEANNELAGSIPGPADGGVGYSDVRDDTNVVSMHPGVVSMADGYTDSVLDSSHRFDSPVAKLVITRTQ